MMVPQPEMPYIYLHMHKFVVKLGRVTKGLFIWTGLAWYTGLSRLSETETE